MRAGERAGEPRADSSAQAQRWFALRGSEDILHHCEKRLGIHAGETTKDGAVTLRTAECLASCGTAPMMQVDKKYYEDLTPERVDEILVSIGAEVKR